MNIAKGIFEMNLDIMKRILSLGEFKFGKDTDQFKFYKQETMNAVYEGTKKFFLKGVKEDAFEPCSCGASLRHGWDKCEHCGGSGFKDKE
jgi:hypothetical protein